MHHVGVGAAVGGTLEIWKREKIVGDRKSGRGWKRKRRVAYLRELHLREGDRGNT